MLKSFNLSLSTVEPPKVYEQENGTPALKTTGIQDGAKAGL